MARLIEGPAVVEAAGNVPKRIEEFVGRVNSATAGVSVARMKSPPGWQEPGQTPEFDEYSIVLAGVLRVETKTGAFSVRAGQAVHAPAGFKRAVADLSLVPVGTPMSIEINVGNAFDAEGPSRAYIDRVRLYAGQQNFNGGHGARRVLGSAHLDGVANNQDWSDDTLSIAPFAPGISRSSNDPARHGIAPGPEGPSRACHPRTEPAASPKRWLLNGSSPTGGPSSRAISVMAHARST